MANSIGELSVLLDAIITPFTSKMDEATKVAAETAKKIEKSGSGMAGGFNLATAAVGGFVGGLTAGLVDKFAGSIGDLATSIVKAGAAAETSQVAFKTLLGSAAGAEQMLKGLQQFAASTPFEFEDLQKSARNMLAFGFSAEQILPMLRKVGDAVSALGGGAPEIDRVTRALGQMQAKGKVSAEEMNQMAELGIPVWKLLAEQIGVSIPKAMKLAEEGAISAATGIDAILNGMGQRFAGGMAAQAETLEGQWSNLKDQMSEIARVLGTMILPAVKEVVTAAGPMVQKFGELVKALNEWNKARAGTASRRSLASEEVDLNLKGFQGSVQDIKKALGEMDAVTKASMASFVAAVDDGRLKFVGFTDSTVEGAGKVGKSASENKVYVDDLTKAIRSLFAKEKEKEIQHWAEVFAVRIKGVGAEAILAKEKLASLDAMLKDVSRPTQEGPSKSEKPTVGLGAGIEEMNAEIAAIPVGLSEADNNMLIFIESTKHGKEAAKELQIQWGDAFKSNSEAMREVSTIMNDLNRDIAQAIIHWGGFKEAGVKALQAVGEMLVRMVIKNLVEASGLLGTVSKGVGALTGALSGGAKVASAVPSLIGGAGAATDLMSGVMNIGTKAAGTASKAVGSVASAGLSSIIGIATGAISAVSDVISNFQFKAMNKSLDLIEHNTRYSMIHLEYLLEKANETWPYLKHINDTLWTPGAPGGGGGGTGITINYTGDVRSLAMMLLSELQRMGLRVAPA